EIAESTVGEAASITIGQLEEFNSSIDFLVNGKRISCPRFAYVNGELKSEFYDICDGDKIRMENFYTVEQLFEFMDLDINGLEVYVNNEPADKRTKVYENFQVNTRSLSMENTLENDNAAEELEAAEPENEDADIEAAEKKGTHTGTEMSDVFTDIVIAVNKTPVRLTGKKNYILVDLFQFYEFDLSRPKGNVVLKLNGEKGNYTAPLKNGDIVDLYWE
ncbi:MAG: cell division protein FtsA, partial [Eubacteriales bacterium]|nr:cell division protein FtsA [Eubacteriales bacterium]